MAAVAESEPRPHEEQDEEEEAEEYEEYDEEEEYEEGEEEYEEEEEEEEEEGADEIPQEGWVSKIAAVGVEPETVDRAMTPLRPDDSMIDRIAEEERRKEEERQRKDKLKKVLGMSVHSVHSATKMKRAAKTKLAAVSAGRKPRKLDPLAALKKSFPEINSARSCKGNIPSGEDEYSWHEKDLVYELNMARSNPKGYSELMAAVLLIGEPFLPSELGKVTYPQLKNFLAETTAEYTDVSSALSTLEESERKEIATLKDQWAVEDAERAKKKKAPAPKKSKGCDADKGPDEAALAAAALEQERESMVKTIVDNNNEQREKLVQGIEAARTKRDNAQRCVEILQQCFKKLAATPTLPQVSYHRGLSLAARDLCANPSLDTAVACNRYGSVREGEDITVVFHNGVTTVRQTVMEMMVCLDDPKRKARSRMLDANALMAGTGWRKDKISKMTHSCLIVSTGFEELENISTHEHMSLTDIRRVLKDETVVAQPRRTMLLLKSNEISLMSPKSHPLVCDNCCSISLDCPERMVINGALYNLRDPPPKAPSHFAGELFVQRVGRQVDIHCVLPHKGKFGLALFVADNSQLVTGNVAVGYKSLGIVRVHSDDWHITKRGTTCPAAYPIASTAFTERQAFLLSPLDGHLKPATMYPFELIVPMTSYLVNELERVIRNLAEAERISSGSEAEGDRLQAVLDQANEELNNIVQAQQEALAPLQQEIAVLIKEQAKKRGKDLEKNKAQVAELETQSKALDESVVAGKKVVAEAEEKIVAHRRTIRQAAAQRLRFKTEHAQIIALTDRSKPLDIELSIEERRAKLVPLDDEYVRYGGNIPTPKGEGGTVSLFIAGTVALSWEVHK